MTIETLNQIFKWTAVILPFVLAFVGFGALITGNIITARKDAEIQSLKAPRNLDDTQQERIISKLTPLGGKPYELATPVNIELGSNLKEELVNVLSKSGWQRKPLPNFTATRPSPMIPGLSGVRITFLPDQASEFEQAAAALSDALNHEGIAASYGASSPTELVGAGTIHIGIGTKVNPSDFP